LGGNIGAGASDSVNSNSIMVSSENSIGMANLDRHDPRNFWQNPHMPMGMEPPSNADVPSSSSVPNMFPPWTYSHQY